ncbi:MAG: hypothetical protein RMM08_03925 [Armatimonadota bacterium]|nr:hypothetical protein [bacterium]MDW8320492.1 hypothetical protein [Armatimonadota bacterium]
MEDVVNDHNEQNGYEELASNHPFTQWLRTYLLWAHITGVEPQVFAFASDAAPSVQDNLRWQGQALWVELSLLERMPSRLLAILAVRNYVEEDIWRRYLPILWLIGIMAVALSIGLSSYLRRVFGANVLWHLVHLFVLPLLFEMPALLREYARLHADEETMQRLAEPDMMLLALETAIVESYRNGEPEGQLHKSLKRLNRLRAKRGEPALTLEQIKAQAGEPLTTEEEEEILVVNTASQEEE